MERNVTEENTSSVRGIRIDNNREPKRMEWFYGLQDAHALCEV